MRKYEDRDVTIYKEIDDTDMHRKREPEWDM